MQGVIKWFSTYKKYGFIKGNDNQDYFFHGTQLKNSSKILSGANVTFQETNTTKGLQAKNVQIIA